jgi:hypothetical protein
MPAKHPKKTPEIRLKHESVPDSPEAMRWIENLYA